MSDAAKPKHRSQSAEPMPDPTLELWLPRPFEVQSLNHDVESGKIKIKPLRRDPRAAMRFGYVLVDRGDGTRPTPYEIKLSVGGFPKLIPLQKRIEATDGQ